MGTLRLTILGCGSSGGVPRADGDWGVCDPKEPKNQRSRCSALLQKWSGEAGRPEEATTVLIDTAPDLRLQLASARPSHLDAVLVSHDHADQIHGFDDIRAFASESLRFDRALHRGRERDLPHAGGERDRCGGDHAECVRVRSR